MNVGMIVPELWPTHSGITFTRIMGLGIYGSDHVAYVGAERATKTLIGVILRWTMRWSQRLGGTVEGSFFDWH
jgi:hypothetical protein